MDPMGFRYSNLPQPRGDAIDQRHLKFHTSIAPQAARGHYERRRLRLGRKVGCVAYNIDNLRRDMMGMQSGYIQS